MDSRCAKLVSKIVDRANRVWLWVYLVARDLLRDISDYKDYLQLQRPIWKLSVSVRGAFQENDEPDWLAISKRNRKQQSKRDDHFNSLRQFLGQEMADLLYALANIPLVKFKRSKRVASEIEEAAI